MPYLSPLLWWCSKAGDLKITSTMQYSQKSNEMGTNLATYDLKK